ncbi:MAG: carbamoyltransferase HypF [Gemmatimonadota bacterium]
MQALALPSPILRHIRVRGLVQGVGFRPFVHRVANELGLDGWVRNDGEGVEIALRGGAEQMARFEQRLRRGAPRLARIDSIEVDRLADDSAGVLEPGFRIERSRPTQVRTGVTPDAAICEACLAELFEPADRRYRYPFINCTHCGPRFTITRALPYDRPNTSMAQFRMCRTCLREYDGGSAAGVDRRFHAQPNACPACGPRLALTDRRGARIECDDVIAETVARIARGEILAIKGLGGFHLVCDARRADAVAELRARKHRDEKPFAVMLANRASVQRFVQVDAAAAALLESIERPIVLLDKRDDVEQALAGIAPGMPALGCMLPYTPLHYLLFHEAAGRPRGTGWLAQPQPLALVMTSANPGGEPLVIGNDEALARLGGIADAFVLHDRDIVVRCDDSVVRAAPTKGSRITDHGSPLFIRRARGYTPAPIRLARAGPPVLATGAYLKNTACLTRGRDAFLSQHIGDLENAASCIALEEAVEHLQRILEIRPAAVAHDLHPDFFSTRLAVQLAAALGVPALGVQHHHAHIAAVMAEHGVTGPVLGLALDGVGHGIADEHGSGDAWGGELLLVGGAECRRLGHLRSLPLPGGDRAAREPWRMAAAVLHRLGRTDEIGVRFARQPAASVVADMLARDLHCPKTTSAGRWFDAAAALLGVRDVMNFEGQAAMLLEGLAQRRGVVTPAIGGYRIEDGELDLLPLAQRLLEERDAEFGAALFHSTLAAGLAEWVARASRATGVTTVALGGGCFINAMLSRQLARLLKARALDVLEARWAPPNDGGVALGQAWVAQQRMGA